MYRKLLVPLDGSAFAEQALPMALGLGARTGAEVCLHTVVEGISALAMEDWEQRGLEWARSYLDEVVDRAVGDGFAGDLKTSVAVGDATASLEERVREGDIDLVVMASHGHGGLTRLWMGSVADGLVRHVDVPVIVVRAEEGEPVPPVRRSVGTILVPLDGSELAEDALRFATDFGELFGRAYHLTRVVSYPRTLATPYLPHTTEMNEEIFRAAMATAAEYLEAHAERMRRRGHRVTTSVSVALQPAQGILDEAKAVGADMIAMSTHGLGGVRRTVLGSTADKVMRGAEIPVLLHREDGSDDHAAPQVA